MSPLLLVVSFIVGQSRAQESEPPVAIPSDKAEGTVSRTMGAPDVPHTPEELQAAMTYRSTHLQIRTVTSWRNTGSSQVVVSGGYGWGAGPRGHGSHMGVGMTTATPAGPIVPEHNWTVFQGPQRLSVPAYLTLVGDSRAEDYKARIRANRTTGGVLTAVGVMGVAAVVAGIIGSANADTFREQDTWEYIALGGTGGIIVGFTGAGIAQSSASKLTWNYDQLGWEPTTAQVDAYNEQLRKQLGLSTEQAWRIIEEGGGRR